MIVLFENAAGLTVGIQTSEVETISGTFDRKTGAPILNQTAITMKSAPVYQDRNDGQLKKPFITVKGSPQAVTRKLNQANGPIMENLGSPLVSGDGAENS